MKVLILSQFSDIIENELPPSDAEVVYERNVRDFELHAGYAQHRFDLLVCFGYGRVLPVDDPAFAGVRFVNLHTSLLPFGRGLNPNFSAWLRGEPHGVTIHEMDGSYDTGRILFQKPVSIDVEGETLRSSYYKKIFAAVELLSEKWADLVAGRYTAVPQPAGPGSITTSRTLRFYADVLAEYNDKPLAEFLAAVKAGRIPRPSQQDSQERSVA